MGCVSSNLLNRDDEFTQLGSSALGHHIVSLTSTTYGLLTLDPPSHSTTIPLSPQPSFTTTGSLWSEPRPAPARPDIINSWELMSGLDADSFRFSPILNPNTVKNVTVSKPPVSRSSLLDKFQADSFRFPNTLLPEKENTDPNLNKNNTVTKTPFSPFSVSPLHKNVSNLCCPPNGENRVVIYTTSLRGIRKTFEDCNAVRSAIESYGVVICERDISMDRGFKEELRELMKGTNQATTPPRVFIKGRYIGGVEEVMRMVDEGWFGDLIKGLPEKKTGNVCDGCGDVKFLPCFRCNGSCKVAVDEKGRKTVVVRCMDCNENGLVLCPICS